MAESRWAIVVKSLPGSTDVQVWMCHFYRVNHWVEKEQLDLFFYTLLLRIDWTF